MPGSKPTIKQKLAAIRMLYDFLVIRQLVPINPTASVRWPKYVVKRGKIPVFVLATWSEGELLARVDVRKLPPGRRRHSFFRILSMLNAPCGGKATRGTH
jgi:site-specific recombinase XerD